MTTQIKVIDNCEDGAWIKEVQCRSATDSMIIVVYSVRNDKEDREQREDFIGMFLPVHALGTVGMDVTHSRKSLNKNT